MWFWLATAGAAPVLSAAEAPPDGPLRSRVVAGDGANLVLLYGGEQDGRAGPCACDLYPKGGLGRITSVAAAVAAADPAVPVLLLATGGTFASASDATSLTPEATAANATLSELWPLARFAALNATYRDLPGMVSAAPAGWPGAVSVTHRRNGVASDVRVPFGDAHVVITGVSRDGLVHLRPAGTTVSDPVDALTAAAFADQDLVIVMAYDLAAEVPRIGTVPGVDVVIDTARWTARYDPRMAGGAVWVRSWNETTRLGELRLWVADGHVEQALDRMIDLGPDVPTPKGFPR